VAGIISDGQLQSQLSILFCRRQTERKFFETYSRKKVLHPNLLKIIETAEENFFFFFIEILTNGMFSPKLLQDLLKTTAKFYVTFEGIPDVQDKFRKTHTGEPSSKQVITTIKKIVDDDPSKLILRMNYSPFMFGREEEIADFLAGLGIKKVALSYLSPMGRGKNCNFIDAKKTMSKYPLMFKELKAKNLVETPTFIKEKQRKWLNCGAGRHLFVLTVDGSISTCQNVITSKGLSPFLEKFIVGRVDDSVLIDKIALTKFIEFADHVPSKCRTCDIVNLCGGCPFRKTENGGEADFPEEFCEVTKIGINSMITVCEDNAKLKKPL